MSDSNRRDNPAQEPPAADTNAKADVAGGPAPSPAESNVETDSPKAPPGPAAEKPDSPASPAPAPPADKADPTAPLAPAKMELWIGADDGLVRKIVMFDGQGAEMISQSYKNVELNPKVLDKEFEFTPPEGVQVMDMTEQTLNMMKQTSQPTQ